MTKHTNIDIDQAAEISERKAMSGFDLSLEFEGRIQEINNLAQTLDLIAEEIAVGQISEPLPERTRGALAAVNLAFLERSRSFTEFFEAHYPEFRRAVQDPDSRDDQSDSVPAAQGGEGARLPPIATTNPSERSPYDKAVHLTELVQAARTIIDNAPSELVAGSGLCSLITILEERSGALANELDAGAFSDCWPAVSAALDKDGSLGFRG